MPWLVPKGTKWALFCDFADMLFLADPAELFRLADDRYAVMVVKHWYEPTASTKMDGQMQVQYRAKNWSSVVLWNLEHFKNKLLTKAMVNMLPGRELHRFCWLEKEDIGELPMEWNWLVGHTEKEGFGPKLLHFTEGLPIMEGYEEGPWSQAWKKELAIMDQTRKGIPV